MSFFMNGKPLWCPPARTRGGVEFVDSDTDDRAAEHISILAEARQLVAAGIRAGLVQAGPEVYDPGVALRRRTDVVAECDSCGRPFSRGKASRQSTCFSCRLGERQCIQCGVTFAPVRREQKNCGVKCAAEGVRTAQLKKQAEKLTKRPPVDCVICGAQHPMRFGGGRLVKTCSKPCADKLVQKNCSKPKQPKQPK